MKFPPGVTFIEVMDTSLRDGEQSPGFSFPPDRKLAFAQFLLGKLGVSRVEVTSAGVSDGEFQMLKSVMDWARANGHEEKIEVLGFLKTESIHWVAQAGCKVVNLLAKGSEHHCRLQLRTDSKGHQQLLSQAINCALYADHLKVNVYLEDWSQGMRDSQQYVKEQIDFLAKLRVERVMLCDTMGVLNPMEAKHFVEVVHGWQPELRLDFHAHNDYGLGTANVLAAISTGYLSGVHTTINGIGERTGNADLLEVSTAVNDHLKGYMIRLDETQLLTASRMMEAMSGRRMPRNKPISGRDARTNTAGIHAHGDRAGSLYHHPKITAERFGGAEVEHALGKMAGKATIANNAEAMGFKLTPEQIGEVTRIVVNYGDEGREITTADLLYIVSQVLDEPGYIVFKLVDAEYSSKKGKRAKAVAVIDYRGQQFSIQGEGDGAFDAFMNALKDWAQTQDVVVPELTDYEPIIPPGGQTSALVQANVMWHGPNGEGHFQTVGLDTDQVLAAVYAAEKAINVCNRPHH